MRLYSRHFLPLTRKKTVLYFSIIYKIIVCDILLSGVGMVVMTVSMTMRVSVTMAVSMT